ncbi:VCBS repeat-containing protein [Streptomyces tricolor]|nr:VCBS repeat-containing protein [Streptomyces tricolor]
MTFLRRLTTSSALLAALTGTVLTSAPLSFGAGSPAGSGAATVRPAMPYDFNGDGYRDLAAGGPSGAVGAVKGAGYTAVVYGSASGPDTARRQILTQDSPGVPGAPETGDWFGWALTSADSDNDGYADLAVGALVREARRRRRRARGRDLRQRFGTVRPGRRVERPLGAAS